MGKDNDFYPDPNRNPYRVRPGVSAPPPSSIPVSPSNSPPPSQAIIDFNEQRICPGCGKIIKITYKFCKFCGLPLSEIQTMKESDDISRQLAITALTDRDSSVRREAIDTLGNFKELSVLGVLTYALLNDPDETVRKEAAEELGNLANPLSLNPISRALKDISPNVRKKAIDGLKKIRGNVKPKETNDGEEETIVPKTQDSTTSEAQEIENLDEVFELDEIDQSDSQEGQEEEDKEVEFKEEEVDKFLDDI